MGGAAEKTSPRGRRYVARSTCGSHRSLGPLVRSPMVRQTFRSRASNALVRPSPWRSVGPCRCAHASVTPRHKAAAVPAGRGRRLALATGAGREAPSNLLIALEYPRMLQSPACFWYPSLWTKRPMRSLCTLALVLLTPATAMARQPGHDRSEE